MLRAGLGAGPSWANARADLQGEDGLLTMGEVISSMDLNAGGAGSLAALENARASIRGGTLGDGTGKASRSHPYFWAPFAYVGD